MQFTLKKLRLVSVVIAERGIAKKVMTEELISGVIREANKRELSMNYLEQHGAGDDNGRRIES